jgi:hypothetical protein
MQPMSVSDDSDNVSQALRGAARKLESMLAKVIGKLESR